MTFEEDLTKRRIDIAAFAAGDPARYAEWQEMYAQMHPNSFYVSVKMVLNDVRRKFWLAEAVKPVVAATDAPAKPIIRRAGIPGAGVAKPTVNSPVATPEPEPAKPIPTAVPGKGRAVIPRATPVKAEIPDTAESAALQMDKPASGEVPKVPRARPVIRRPTPITDNLDIPATEKEQIVQDGTNEAVPFHTNPEPEVEEAPKPPRPRPVFKKPGAASPVEQPTAETPELSLSTEDETVTPVSEPTKTEAAKPPRPRPIFKRPIENTNVAEPKPDNTIPIAENLNQDVEPSSTENNEAVPAAKPPRPRPVIRRPNPAPEASQPPETTPLESKIQEEAPVPPAIEPAKPPRPRPVFKRPAKPDDLNQ